MGKRVGGGKGERREGQERKVKVKQLCMGIGCSIEWGRKWVEGRERGQEVGGQERKAWIDLEKAGKSRLHSHNTVRFAKPVVSPAPLETVH